jgi:hypothetical protein
MVVTELFISWQGILNGAKPGKVTHPLTVTSGKVLTLKEMYLFSGELDNGNYDALMPVEENESVGILDKIFFL